MIRSRNQNSFPAVATLGVYLGLILAGATPSVLAQAATAKQFNIKDEVVKKDDLDKNPDGCNLLAAKVKEKHAQFGFDEKDLLAYASGLTDALRSYVELHGTLLDLRWDTAIQKFRLAEANEKPVLRDAKAPRPPQTRPGLALSGILPNTAFEYSVTSNGYDIVATANARHHDDLEAHRVAVAYQATLDLYSCSSPNPLQKLILNNTDVAWADDQIFLITHLPRGSLDTLLASHAK